MYYNKLLEGRYHALKFLMLPVGLAYSCVIEMKWYLTNQDNREMKKVKSNRYSVVACLQKLLLKNPSILSVQTSSPVKK